MESFKVSVISAVYNTEKYLDKCISSVTGQTYRNIELIMVNDGSTDSSRDIILRHIEQDPSRIRLIDKENGGQASARNMGIKEATGDYLMFIDSDDYIARDYIETLIKATENGKNDVVISGQNKVGEDGTVIDVISYASKRNDTALRRLNNHGKMYRTEYIRKYSIEFPAGKLYEDNSFNLLSFFLTDKVAISGYRGYNQVVHEGSTTAKKIEADSLPWENWQYCISKIREEKANGNPGDTELFDFTILSFFTYFLMVRNRKREYLSDDKRKDETDNIYEIADRFQDLVVKNFDRNSGRKYMSLFRSHGLPLLQRKGTSVFLSYCLKGKIRKLVRMVYSL